MFLLKLYGFNLHLKGHLVSKKIEFSDNTGENSE